MNTKTILILMTCFPAALHAQTKPAQNAPDKPEAQQTKVGSPVAKLKQQLITAATADHARIAAKDPQLASLLDQFIRGVHGMSPYAFREMDARRFETNLQSEVVSDETRALFQSYLAQVKSESLAIQNKFKDEFTAAGRAFIKRAMVAANNEESEAINAQIETFCDDTYTRSQNELGVAGSQISQLKTQVTLVTQFQVARTKKSWNDLGGLLYQIQKNFEKNRSFISADEVEAFLDEARKSIGMPSLQDNEREFQETLDALFNDANQDRLDEIADKILKYQLLFGSSSSPSPEATNSIRWRALRSLASTFAQNVQLVKNGGSSQFSPDQWLRSNSETKPLISKTDLTERLKNYKVKVAGDAARKGGVELMYYDAREVLDRIGGPADLAKELTTFNKAVRMSSYDSDGSNLSSLGPILAGYADLHAKLEAGTAFSLGGVQNPSYPNSLTRVPSDENNFVTAKIAMLNEQLQWQILRRFFPEIQADMTGTPASAMNALLEKSIAEKNYSDILSRNQVAAYISPSRQGVAPTELRAIHHYLAGIRQEELLSEPRLATYHFQKSIAIQSSIIPVEELKARLQRLKREFPADYEKGTDDSFNPDGDERYRMDYSVLTLPAKK